MKIFWKWMREKEYGLSDEMITCLKRLHPPEGEAEYDLPAKQMMIGYMIEYLYCRKDVFDIEINISNYYKDINKVYDILKQKIEEIKK